jgi:ABC-type uncharacterized transport system permease subunit
MMVTNGPYRRTLEIFFSRIAFTGLLVVFFAEAIHRLIHFLMNRCHGAGKEWKVSCCLDSDSVSQWRMILFFRTDSFCLPPVIGVQVVIIASVTTATAVLLQSIGSIVGDVRVIERVSTGKNDSVGCLKRCR